ncbi:GNAT family N-acetyltransferase [Konateibacter massiliensis]|uniref:GNAT family N-acetyltransferase n=1 Tax=Konateibacter massiliensis TaxID=2002841 RepID=UPI001F3825D1|nr:GNAT family N-acetyltransferase [Konateibacter massiliensis]
MKINDWNKIHEYCMKKPCTYESRPFGEYPICYRVSGKIFAQLTPREDWFKITLKTNPDSADFYRSLYPGVVVRGYHCPPVQQPYWNTIELNEFSFDTLCQMIDEAYDEVVGHLTKKEQKRLPLRADYRFVKTDGTNSDFVMLCEELDESIDEQVAGRFDREKFVKYNQLQSIHDVILIYKGEEIVGGGAYKFYDEETVELKRIFLRKEYRALGLGKELLLRLEADARIQGFRYGILETGNVLKDAIRLYQKMGYKAIPNYGQYADIPESLCMQKKL